MRLTCLIFMTAFALSWATKPSLNNEPLESLDIIETINNANTTWKAGKNFHSSVKQNMIKRLVSKSIQINSNGTIPKVIRQTEMLELPTGFDARKHWKHCSSIKTIQDQGPCPASWAVASASALTDRFCIANEGFFQKPLSAEYILACYGDGGCDGTYSISSVWWDFQTLGLVTGGGQNSKNGCQPYSLPACDHHVKGGKKNCYSYKHIAKPQCSNKCTNDAYAVSFEEDFYRAKSYFQIHEDVNQTLLDLYLGGPLVTCFTIYEDFLSYKSGVYQHLYGRELGSTCVKILGWGVEEETPYWLAANTWNSGWGEKGYFKIRRGTNECGFESWVYGGIPDVLR